MNLDQYILNQLLAINNQRQAVEIALLREENAELRREVARLGVVLDASERSHEALTARVIAEAVE